KQAAKASNPSPKPTDGVNPGLAISKGQIIKATDLNAEALGTVKVHSFNPAELIGKRLPKPQAQAHAQAAAAAIFRPQNAALESLKDNLKTLQQLQSRLKFMLQELEELVKE
ncbi:MAG: hypothetical protein ACXWP5_06895, partial [Bdellovibrionota bacterium]